jgi:hypothetical protein
MVVPEAMPMCATIWHGTVGVRLTDGVVLEPLLFPVVWTDEEATTPVYSFTAKHQSVDDTVIVTVQAPPEMFSA